MRAGTECLDMAPETAEPVDEAVERILFDIRLLGARRGWGESTVQSVRDRILASHDEDAKQFVAALEPRRNTRPWGEILVGAGELVLGALLTVAGLVLVVPALLGFTSRGEIARYLSELSLGLLSTTLSDPLVVALGFGFSLFLLLAALYTLRQASRNFRRSGLTQPAE